MPEEIDKKIEIKKEVPISPEQEIMPGIKPEEAQKSKEILKPTPAPAPVEPEIKEEIKKIKALDEKRQVKVLCDLAFQKGLDQAIKTARSLDNAYVLDEFHDTLIDELREQLVKKGRLAEKSRT